MAIALLCILLFVLAILITLGFHLALMPYLLQIVLAALGLGVYSFVQCIALWVVIVVIISALKGLHSFIVNSN